LNQEDIIKVAQISIDAGEAILEVYNSANFGIEIKKDNSPLTIADSKSNEVIIDGLRKLEIDGKDLPLLSEEGKNIGYEDRKNWGKYWLIDPLDGTKEFIKKNGEFTVNIALIENCKPIAGFVYIPVTDILFFGIKKQGSFKLTEASGKVNFNIFDNSEKLSVNSNLPETINVVASRSHLTDETEDFISALEKKFKKVSTVSSGSSIKLCMVADGNAHVYPRFAPTMEWDTAAAHAVCKYAGVRVIDYKTRNELKYNKSNLLNNWFLVSSNEEFEEI